MNKLNVFLLVFCFHIYLWSVAQEDTDDGMIDTEKERVAPTSVVDSLYLEDQFYLGFTYDYLAGKASNVVQHNLSRGLHLGYIRDLPLNAERNLGFGLGIGYAYDRVYNNMLAKKTSAGISYEIVEHFRDLNLSRNFFETHTIEIPAEFRFRTSTPYSHKFWRVYAGVRLAYIFSSKSLYTADDVSTSFANSQLNREFQLKPYIAFGYNALNFFVQYNLTPLLKNAETTDGTSLKSNILQIGLMFYIL